MYLGDLIDQVNTDDGRRCWALLYEHNVKNAVITVEGKLQKEVRKLPGKCTSPMTPGYHHSLETSLELGSKDLRYYQELIGMLRRSIDVGWVDILLEVAVLSSHLDLPRTEHLEETYHIFGCMKNWSRRRIFLDPYHSEICEDRFSKFY